MDGVSVERLMGLDEKNHLDWKKGEEEPAAPDGASPTILRGSTRTSNW